MISQLHRRFYTNYFSQHAGLTLAAAALYALSFTPLAKIEVQFAVNQDLVFSLRFTAILLFLLGFRANYPFLKVLHIVASVAVGIVPTMFLAIISSGALFVALLGGIFSVLGGGIDKEWLASMAEFSAFWLVSVSITMGTWLLIARGIFAQYKEQHALDSTGSFITVALLLFFFGFFGGHRFYTGKVVSGIIYAMTFGVLGFGVLYDSIMLLLGKFTDSKGNPL